MTMPLPTRAALLLAVSLAACTDPQAPVRTGDPVVVGVGQASPPMTEAEYRAAVADSASRTVPLVTLPPSLSSDARFGVGLRYGGTERSWVLDTRADGTPVFYGDYNADGDLTNDPSLVLAPGGMGWVGTHRESRVDTLGGETVEVPFLLGVKVSEFRTPGDDTPTRLVVFRTRQLREGTVRLGDRDVRFGLVGTAGRFDGDRAAVYLDLDGDGALDLSSENDAAAPPSPEQVDPDATVTVGDTEYRLEVDPLGRSLTVRPIGTPISASRTVEEGTPAPDVTLPVLGGPPVRLADLRGRVVVLDFWGLWCAPCIAQVPDLVDAHRQLADDGLTLVSVNVGDGPDAVRAFARERHMDWFHVAEPQGGPLSTAFQVRAFPTLVVVGRDGTLRSARLDPGVPLAEAVRPILNG